jgi:hypothetical protein
LGALLNPAPAGTRYRKIGPILLKTRSFQIAFRYFRHLRQLTITLGNEIALRQQQQPLNRPLPPPKMFHLFPVGEAGINFIRFDAPSLRWLFENPLPEVPPLGNNPTPQQIQDWTAKTNQRQAAVELCRIPDPDPDLDPNVFPPDPWGYVFNLRTVHLSWSPAKTMAINTDGVSISVTYSRDELERPNDVFRRNKPKRVKRRYDPGQAGQAGPAPPLPRTGVIKLEDITSDERLRERLSQSLLHGIDPGVIDVLRVVRESPIGLTRPLATRNNVNPGNNLRISGAQWKRAIMTKYFEKQDLKLRRRFGVTPILNQLAQGARRSVAEWQAYLDVQFRNIRALSDYHNHKSHRRARRTKKIMRQSMLDRIRNAILPPVPAPAAPAVPAAPAAPVAPLVQFRRINPLNRREPAPAIAAEQWLERPRTPKIRHEGVMPPVIAWGSAFFGNPRGRHSLPVKLFQEYLGRFSLVILTPEPNSSKWCPCGDGPDRRTVPYQVVGRACDHQKRYVYHGEYYGNGFRKRKSRIHCFNGQRRGPLTRVATQANPLGIHHVCVNSQQQIQLNQVRHRVCLHCRCDHVYFYGHDADR